VAVLLFLCFIVLPIVELAVIVQVAGSIGVGETILLLIVVSAVGAWLVKREGLGVLRRIRGSLDRGQVPARDLIDGALLLFAGALLLTPGFVTDVLGLSLCLPPVRAGVRAVVARRLRGRLVTYRVGSDGRTTQVHEINEARRHQP
jgi:UPF0716 protein FxsA